MKAAFRVLFTRVERFFLKNNKAFVLGYADVADDDSTDSNFDYSEKRPYTKALLEATKLSNKKDLSDTSKTDLLGDFTRDQMSPDIV